MNNLIPFMYGAAAIRVMTVDDEPWFVAKDIAEVLGYSDAFEMTKKLDDDEKQNLKIAGFGPRGASLVSEAGLYSAILTSHKPEAKRFKRWVTHEVLPAIRRTGGYHSHTTGTLPGELAIAECFVRWLRPAPSTQVAMLEQIAKQNGLNAGFLPGYVIDAVADAAAESSMATAALSRSALSPRRSNNDGANPASNPSPAGRASTCRPQPQQHLREDPGRIISEANQGGPF